MKNHDAIDPSTYAFDNWYTDDVKVFNASNFTNETVKDFYVGDGFFSNGSRVQILYEGSSIP